MLLPLVLLHVLPHSSELRKQQSCARFEVAQQSLELTGGRMKPQHRLAAMTTFVLLP